MVSILSDIYPCSLAKWLNRTKAIPPGYRATRDDPIHALNIARKLNLRSLLPGLMYLVSRYQSLEKILYGVPGKPLLNIEDVDDRKRCALAIPQLILARRRVLMGFLVADYENHDCDDYAACDAERFRCLADDLDEDDQTDPLKKRWDGVSSKGAILAVKMRRKPTKMRGDACGIICLTFSTLAVGAIY